MAMKSQPFRIVDHKFVQKTESCWLWTGSKTMGGYGVKMATIHGSKRPHLVHRIAFEQELGPIPDGLVVCHTCDVRNCLNPAHLFIGTQKDNLADMTRKNRWWTQSRISRSLKCKRGHLFDKSVKGHPNQNRCGECARIKARNFRRRRKAKILMFLVHCLTNSQSFF